MRKQLGLVLLFAMCMGLTGCSAPADEPARQWIQFLEKHQTLLESDDFNVESFKDEGLPLAKEINKHRNPDNGKILMTEDVLTEWKRVNKEFGKAIDKYSLDHNDPGPSASYAELVDIVVADEPSQPSK